MEITKKIAIPLYDVLHSPTPLSLSTAIVFFANEKKFVRKIEQDKNIKELDNRFYIAVKTN